MNYMNNNKFQSDRKIDDLLYTENREIPIEFDDDSWAKKSKKEDQWGGYNNDSWAKKSKKEDQWGGCGNDSWAKKSKKEDQWGGCGNDSWAKKHEDDDQWGGCGNDSWAKNHKDDDQWGGYDDDVPNLYSMFNKAKSYSRNMDDQNSIRGGAKRELNPKLRLGLDLAGIMKKSGKYPEVGWTQLISVSKLIIADAMDKTGKTDVDDSVKRAAMDIVKNPQKYIDQIKTIVCKMPKKPKKMKGGFGDDEYEVNEYEEWDSYEPYNDY